MYTGTKIVLSVLRLKELMEYDPLTGIFTRVKDIGSAKKGDEITSKHNQGYLRVGIDGDRYLVHRLAFLYMEGRMPDEIDHIDGVRSNNKWSNLRECNSQQNSYNSRIAVSDNKGVYWNKDKRKWQAQLSINGVQTYLGRFDDLQEARDVVFKARIDNHGDFACHI